MRETWVWSLSGGDSPEGGHGNPLQYSCLENPMDRGAWRATVHRVQRVGQEGSNIARTHADNHTEWTQSGVTFQHYEQRRWLLNVINGHRRVCSAQSNVEDHFFMFFFHLLSFWISHPLPNIHSKQDPTVDLTSPYEFTVWTGCFSLGSLITGKKRFFPDKEIADWWRNKWDLSETLKIPLGRQLMYTDISYSAGKKVFLPSTCKQILLDK